MADLGITLTANEEALDKLAEQGFDPVYGARPLRRTIQAIIEDGVAEMMLDGRLKKGDKVEARVSDGKIVLEKLT